MNKDKPRCSKCGAVVTIDPDQPHLPKYRRIPIETNNSGIFFAEQVHIDRWQARADFAGFEYKSGNVSVNSLMFRGELIKGSNGMCATIISGMWGDNPDGMKEQEPVRPKWVLVKEEEK